MGEKITFGRKLYNFINKGTIDLFNVFVPRLYIGISPGTIDKSFPLFSKTIIPTECLFIFRAFIRFIETLSAPPPEKDGNIKIIIRNGYQYILQ